MSESKPASKQTLAVLGVGSAAALGAAYWSISQALAPPPVAHTLPPVPSTNNGGLPTSPGLAAAALVPAVTPAPLPGSAADIAARSTAASQMSGDNSGARQITSSEAVLAPNADPFTPISPRSLNPGAVGSAPARSVTQAQPIRISRSLGFSSLDPILSDPQRLSSRPLPPLAVAEAPAPELVGTLLGEQPSAVFRGQSQLVAVPVGGSFGAWKVMEVSHGGVVVKGMGRTVRLGIAGSAAPAEDRPNETDGPTPSASPLTQPTGADEGRQQSVAAADAATMPERSEATPPPTDNSFSNGSAISGGEVTVPAGSESAPPALRDSSITPLDNGSASSGNSLSPFEFTDAADPADGTARPALAGGYAPFRRLVALDSDNGPGAALPVRAVAHGGSEVAARRQGRSHNRNYYTAIYQAH